MRLRDHDRPCEHGSQPSHTYELRDYPAEPQSGILAWCPGGAEVTIDYEAASDMLDDGGYGRPEIDRLVRRIAAALGIVEDE